MHSKSYALKNPKCLIIWNGGNTPFLRVWRSKWYSEISFLVNFTQLKMPYIMDAGIIFCGYQLAMCHGPAGRTMLEFLPLWQNHKSIQNFGYSFCWVTGDIIHLCRLFNGKPQKSDFTVSLKESYQSNAIRHCFTSSV